MADNKKHANKTEVPDAAVKGKELSMEELEQVTGGTRRDRDVPPGVCADGFINRKDYSLFG